MRTLVLFMVAVSVAAYATFHHLIVFLQTKEILDSGVVSPMVSATNHYSLIIVVLCYTLSVLIVTVAAAWDTIDKLKAEGGGPISPECSGSTVHFNK